MRLQDVLHALWPFSSTTETAGEDDGAPAPGDRASFAACARRTYDAMQYHFAADAPGTFLPHYPRHQDDPPAAYHWPLTQALTAELDMARLDGNTLEATPRCLAALEPYWDAEPAWGQPGYASAVLPPRGPGGDKYYDDNAWAGLLLSRAYRLTGNERALRRAEAVYAFVLDGWADDPVCQGQPSTGGIFWKQQTPGETIHDRNTVSNAPTAELGLLLQAQGGQQTGAERARQIYDWVVANLRDPDDGLYWDHVGPTADGACAVERTKWSYNQGTMIGANVLLHRRTGEPHYLEEAKAIAAAALRHYGCTPGCGPDSPILRQSPAFNAIFFRNLLLLASVATDPAYRQAMESYAILMWHDDAIRRRTPHGTLFALHDGRADLLDQAAMAQIYACLAWDPAGYGEIM